MTDRERIHEDDDLALSRLIDGEVSDDERTALRRRLDSEPSLARRYDELRRADEAVRAVYGGVADEPLPADVVRLLEPAPVPFRRPVPTPRREAISRTLTAVAALAAGFLLAVLFLARPSADGLSGQIVSGGLVAPGSPLHEALQTLSSGDTAAVGGGWSATPRLTFMSTDGIPCRRVDLAGEEEGRVSLACRTEAGWRMELVAFDASVASGGGRGFRPASGPGSRRIDDAIDASIEGEPLGRDAERDMMERGWRRDAEN